MAYPVAYQSYHMAYPLIHAYPGWWFQPLKNMKVRLDHHPNYWGK